MNVGLRFKAKGCDGTIKDTTIVLDELMQEKWGLLLV